MEQTTEQAPQQAPQQVPQQVIEHAIERTLQQRIGASRICGRCHEVHRRLQRANCAERPEYAYGPARVYPCPDCGALLLSGVPHPRMCQACMEREHVVLDQVSA